LQYLLQRINDFTALRAVDDLAIPVIDSVEDKANRSVSEAMSNFLFRHYFGQTFAHIVDFPTFGDSRTTPGLQLADFVAYCVNSHAAGRREAELVDAYNKLKGLTHNWTDGNRVTDWGFRIIL